ncbi:MAG TPA: trigger factor [Thermoanaerobaculia bacterium]|nr:trigger factor [Thermoanaerobaculia bacterium]
MLIEFKDLSTVRKNVEVEVPAEAVTREFGSVAAEFARQAKIPGFREGKIPIGVVRTRFQKEIQDEVVQRLLPKFFNEVVSEKGLETVGDPQLKRVDPLIDGAPLKFEAEFEVKPAVELQNYRGLETSAHDTEVPPADLEAMIERLRDQGSTYRIVDDRGAQDGDFVIMDIESSGEGVESRKSESAHVQLGEETPLPELHEALQGKRPGETAEFDKSYAEDAVNEELRGKQVHYAIAVKELRFKEKPELTDEFAKSLGWESVEDLRQKLLEDMKRHKEAEGVRARRQEIGDKLVELHTLEVPASLVEDELGNALRNYARYLSSQGVDLEKVEIDWAKVRTEFRPDAESRAKRGLILEAIARQEGLTVSDTEVDAEIRKASADARREFAEIRHQLKHDGGYEALRLSLLQEKALDFVLEAAVPAQPARL